MWWTGSAFSVANVAKFRKIPRHYYLQIPYILWPVGVVILTDKTSMYKEFIVTCKLQENITLAINDENSVLTSQKLAYKD